MKTLIPYLKDFTTAKAAKASWAAGKDWLICDRFDRYDGKPTSQRDWPKTYTLQLRFNRLTKSTMVKGAGS